MSIRHQQNKSYDSERKARWRRTSLRFWCDEPIESFVRPGSFIDAWLARAPILIGSLVIRIVTKPRFTWGSRV